MNKYNVKILDEAKELSSLSNEEALNNLSIDRLRKLEKYYDNVIKENKLRKVVIFLAKALWTLFAKCSQDEKKL